MDDLLKVLVTPLLLLLAPLVWNHVQPSLTRSSRLKRRISDHQALVEKLPPDSEAATNLQAEIERQVNELVHYWEDRRSKTTRAKAGQPVREYGRGVVYALVATSFGVLASVSSPLLEAWLSR